MRVARQSACINPEVERSKIRVMRLSNMSCHCGYAGRYDCLGFLLEVERSILSLLQIKDTLTKCVSAAPAVFMYSVRAYYMLHEFMTLHSARLQTF